MGHGVAGDLDLRQSKDLSCRQLDKRGEVLLVNNVPRDETNADWQIRIGFDDLLLDDLSRNKTRNGLGSVDPTITVDMAEVNAAPRDRCRIRHRPGRTLHYPLQVAERINEPHRPLQVLKEVHRVTAGYVSAIGGYGGEYGRLRHAGRIGRQEDFLAATRSDIDGEAWQHA